MGQATSYVWGQTCHLCECQVDAVCKGCDDQPPVQAHVLIAVAKSPRALADVELVWLPVPVKAKLAFPFKLPGLKDAGWGGEEKEGGIAGQTTEGHNSKASQNPGESNHLPRMKESTMSRAWTSMIRTVLYFFLSFLLSSRVIRVTRSSICLCIFLP